MAILSYGFNIEKVLTITGFAVLLFAISGNTTVNAQTPPPSSPVDNNLPTIGVTSHQDGQQVSVGELTIEGISSDDVKSNCQVYADVNDIKPLQNVTATGPGGANDYSNWTFTYTNDYHLIEQGVNELTTKISCFDVSGPTPMSKWYSINVTGVATAPDSFVAPAPLP